MNTTYDYYLDDLVEAPPYSHYDMVVALAEGRFIVEGKPSTFNDAHYYATQHANESSVWDALKNL